MPLKPAPITRTYLIDGYKSACVPRCEHDDGSGLGQWLVAPYRRHSHRSLEFRLSP